MYNEPMPTLTRLWSVSLLLAVSETASAQLNWETQQLEIHPALQETNAVVYFKFRNGGGYPVKILSLKSSCDCAVAGGNKKLFAPGEEGAIRVVYDIGDDVGTKKRTVTVKTDDPKDAATQLTLVAHVPETLKLSPRFLHWQLGEEAKPKTLKLKVADGIKLEITKVQPSSEKLKVQLLAVKPGEEYEVFVTPSDTSQAELITLRIEAGSGRPKPRAFFAYALFK